MQRVKKRSQRKSAGNSKNSGPAFSVDSAFVIRTWNAHMERLFHNSAQNVIGSSVQKVFPILHEKVESVFADGRNRQIKDFRSLCLLGSDLAADIQLNAVKDRDGKIREVSVEFRKISGECPMNKTLSDSERMIAVGKIASALAHGIRNPLNAIKGAVVYLNEKYGREQTLIDFSKIINEEIDRLDNFISNFLSMAKAEVEPLPTDLNDILKTIIGMIKPRTELQNIKVITAYSALPHIMLAPFQVEQAFFNIINNALEAMPDGGSLNIETSLGIEHGARYAVVNISDTGKGIPKKTLSNLGELSGNSGGGRGFGIFLSREIIKSHGGKLFWESLKDIGTSFKVFLPIK